MKRILKVIFIIAIIGSMNLNHSLAAEYVLYELISVSESNKEEYLNLEKSWAPIYKQLNAEGVLPHWEIYQLIPSGTSQESQFLRVSVFFNLSNALSYMNYSDVTQSEQIAYPQKSDEELRSMIERMQELRNIEQQILYEQIDRGKRIDFKMNIGFVAALEFTKQVDDTYEQVSSQVFKPFYQTHINNGKVGHWGFMRAILPFGNDAQLTHTSFLFFNDMDHMAAFMNDTNYPTHMKTNPEFEEGLKTRELKKLILAKLIMKK